MTPTHCESCGGPLPLLIFEQGGACPYCDTPIRVPFSETSPPRERRVMRGNMGVYGRLEGVELEGNMNTVECAVGCVIRGNMNKVKRAEGCVFVGNMNKIRSCDDATEFQGNMNKIKQRRN